MPGASTITDLLKPHKKALALGLLAVLGETAANLLEPWPLKIVLDNVLKGRPIHGWLNPLILSVSFKIEPGQMAAFVGPTGAGKTTIVSLIPRFYDPASGVVTIDGFDVRQFKLKSLRQQISFVLQETLLFHGTIWHNIAYGKPDASRAEILRAAQLPNASEA